MDKVSVPSVFEYSDYRSFLNDYFKAHKQRNRRYSYQLLANKAGFHSRAFLHNVMRGRKNLSRESALSLAEAMEMTRTETEYFDALVGLNQAKNFKQKNHYFEKLQALRPYTKDFGQAKRLRDDQFDFYSEWHHSAIRSLIDFFPFKGDYTALEKRVYPPLGLVKIKKSVALLTRLGLIQRGKDGVYRLADKSITTGPEVKSLAVQKLHLAMMELAAGAVKNLPREKRHITGLTLGISSKAYEAICREILAFQEKIMGIANGDKDSDRVYQLNFHFFPLSTVEGAQRSAS
jgi:uncharacterized protein (TIGR02147 family)